MLTEAAAQSADINPTSSISTHVGIKKLDFNLYLNGYAKRLGPSPLKSLLKYTLDKENIYLASGLPRADTFPIEKISLSVRDPITTQLTTHVINQTGTDSSPIGLNQAQQYMNGKGNPILLQFFNDHTNQIHSPIYSDYQCIPTTGNTDALFKIVQVLMTEGEPVLVARWCYPTALELFSASGCNLLKVEIDNEGLVPRSLENVASEWNAANPSRPVRYIYVVPCGQNPTGATMGKQRRSDIYTLAQQLNLILLEDDPYYYLQLPNVDIEPEHPDYLQHYGYKSLLPSLLSMDMDGRVIRFDSFSKVIAPGHRIGWITADKVLIDKLQYLNEISVQFPSGLSQTVLAQLFLDAWSADPKQSEGLDKLEYHIANLRYSINKRKISTLESLATHLGTKAKYQVPKAGMFIWIKPNLPSHLITQSDNTLPTQKTMIDLFDKLISNQVVIVPGAFFDTESYANKWTIQETGQELDGPGAPFLRLCFTFADQAKVQLGIERIGRTLTELGC